MQLVNDVFLFPYYTFNYLFSLAFWVVLVLYTLNWLNEHNSSDWFQYKFNRILDKVWDAGVAVMSWFGRIKNRFTK
jgi:hypothetical protein